MKSVIRAAFAAALFAAALSGCGGSVLPQIHSPEDRVPTARRLLERGSAQEAIDLLKTYTATGGGAADIDEAVYLLGQCYLRTKDWASAQLEFERLLRDYPESDSASSGSFRLAESYFGQSRGPDFDQEHTLKAMQQWQEYLKTSEATHWLRPEAERRVLECRTRLATKLLNTGLLYVKLRAFEPARTYFQTVIDEYSDTAPYGDALIGLSVADARLGQKPLALSRLRELEQRFSGQPLGVRAARQRAEIERWPDRPDTGRKGKKSVESPATAAGGPGL